jgi:tRNA(Ile2) C34 agmatinyltransferase TiaS
MTTKVNYENFICNSCGEKMEMGNSNFICRKCFDQTNVAVQISNLVREIKFINQNIYDMADIMRNEYRKKNNS